MSRSILRAVLMAMVLIALSTTLLAQQTGSISGSVSDKTGAVVSDAKVTLINSATNDIRRATSNSQGFFSFSAVVTGSYVLKVESKGFKTEERNGISLDPGDRRNFNVQLEVGAEAVQVTVDAAAEQIQVVDSGERSSVLTSKDIKNLALEGRDVTELVKVLPGFNNMTGFGGVNNKSGYDPSIVGVGSAVGNGYSANGVPNRTGTALTSDGANIIDPGCNCNSTQTVNGDMVQEVKVSTSAYGADSELGPILIQAVGKSGTSRYHGQLYMHYRDAVMNSTDWFTGYNKVAKPDDHYAYPGGNFGGPVPFTKKLFFWAGFEDYRQSFPDQISNGVVTNTVPTMSMRSGNFDPTAADNATFCAIGGWLPQCGGITTINVKGVTPTQILNNNIASYIDPGGAAIMKEIVQPNFVPTADHPYNFVHSEMQYGNGYMFHTRVDYNIGDKTKLYVSYNQQRDKQNLPVMLWWAPPNEEPFPGGFVQGGDSKTISGNLVSVFSSTLTNEFIASLAYLDATKSYSNPNGVSRAALGYPYHGIFGNSKYMPMLSTGWWIPGYPMIYQPDADGYFAKKVTPSFTDNLTKVIGVHTLKFGVNIERAKDDELQFNEQNGSYQFGPNGASGNPVANILLAVPTYYEESSPNVPANVSKMAIGVYVQDDWKVTKRLTLNLGMRFTHDTAWTDNSGKNGIAVWSPQYYAQDVADNISSDPGMRWNSIDSSIPMSGRTNQALFVAPRIGVAWNLFGNDRTILRGGWGRYYFPDSIAAATGGDVTAMGGNMCAVYSPTWLGNIDQLQGVSCNAIRGTTAVNPNDHKESYTDTYNLTLSRQLLNKTLLEVAYSGNRTKDLINPLLQNNINVIPLGAFFGKNPVTGVVESITNIENGKDSTTGASINPNQYRPMQQYGSLSLIDHGAWANYNALQVSWNKPGGDLTYGVNYVYSRAMGINGEQDPINIHNDYGVLNMDRTHVLNATYSYQLNTRFNGIKGGLINGWLISGITSLQSGGPMAPSGSINYGLAGTDGGNNTAYPNFYLDHDAILGSSDYTVMPTLSCNPAANLSGGKYFNPNCFGVPKIGTNGGYQTPYVHLPPYWNSDLRLGKTVKITENQNVQFSVAAFNFLNHALTSFNSNSNSNMILQYEPTTQGLPDYTGYNGPYTLVPPSGNVVTGKPNIKFGRRVVELSFKYSF